MSVFSIFVALPRTLFSIWNSLLAFEKPYYSNKNSYRVLLFFLDGQVRLDSSKSRSPVAFSSNFMKSQHACADPLDHQKPGARKLQALMYFYSAHLVAEKMTLHVFNHCL